ncbi:MAG TPA: Holliday junction resolvase RuvX [Clostridiales bacterium]|nr:Holliday junction resolvase RuvX [Clostridiales bacterium]
MRILSLDVGTKNIGMAVCDPLGITAQPLPTIRRRDDLCGDLRQIDDAVRRYQVERIVVGLPKNMNGTEGPSCSMAKEFAAAVEKETGLPIVYWDERLTSKMAESAMIEADLSRKKRKREVDSLAAILILQNYLDFLRSGSNR